MARAAKVAGTLATLVRGISSAEAGKARRSIPTPADSGSTTEIRQERAQLEVAARLEVCLVRRPYTVAVTLERVMQAEAADRGDLVPVPATAAVRISASGEFLRERVPREARVRRDAGRMRLREYA